MAGGERDHTGDVGQKDGYPKWAGEGLTLGISVISVGDTAESLLPGCIPDLGRHGQLVRRRQCAGTALGRGNPHWGTRAMWEGGTLPALGAQGLLNI